MFFKEMLYSRWRVAANQVIHYHSKFMFFWIRLFILLFVFPFCCYFLSHAVFVSTSHASVRLVSERLWSKVPTHQASWGEDTFCGKRLSKRVGGMFGTFYVLHRSSWTFKDSSEEKELSATFVKMIYVFLVWRMFCKLMASKCAPHFQMVHFKSSRLMTVCVGSWSLQTCLPPIGAEDRTSRSMVQSATKMAIAGHSLQTNGKKYL